MNIQIYSHEQSQKSDVISGIGEFVESPKSLNQEGKHFWKEHLLGVEANGGAVAKEDGSIVGFCRYDFSDGVLYTCGTWVSPHDRGQGIALNLWRPILSALPDDTLVYAFAISDGGAGLFKKLAPLYPNLRWDIATETK
jgi:hypothetical protein